MKKIFYLILLLSFNFYGQQASKVNNAQNVWTVNHDPAVLLECDPILSGLFRPRIKDSIYWETYNINGLESYIQGIGDIRFKSISYTPTYGEIIASLGYTPYNNTNPAGYISTFTEVDPVWLSVAGNYRTKVQNDLLYEPIFSKNTAFNKNFGTTTGTVTEGNDSRVLNGQTAFSWGNHALAGYITTSSTNTLTNKSGNISQWTNDSGYLTSFTELDPTVPVYSKTLTAFSIIKASTDPLYKSIGYTPTSLEITTALGFTPYNSSNPAGYINSYTETDPLFDTKFAAKSTTNLTEGTNLYYTSTRFNTAFSAKSTTDLTEGTKLYFTNARARTAISLTTTGTGTAAYDNSTGILNIPPPLTIADNTVTRTINSSTYTISSTRGATVKYNIKIACTATIGSASSGKVLFQYSVDAGSNWIDAGEVENSNTVTLAIVLNSSTTQTGFIVWSVPANALCRLVPTSSGTTTITWVRGQESY